MSLAVTLIHCNFVRQTEGNCRFGSNGNFVSLDVKAVLGINVLLLS